MVVGGGVVGGGGGSRAISRINGVLFFNAHPHASRPGKPKLQFQALDAA